MKIFLKALKKNWLVWGGLIAAVALFGYLAIEEFQRWYSLRSELGERQEEIEKVRAETDKLQVKLQRVSDPAYLEKQARQRLNLKGEDEEVFVVVGLENITKEEDFSTLFQDDIEKKEGIWFNVKSWYRYFFH